MPSGTRDAASILAVQQQQHSSNSDVMSLGDESNGAGKAAASGEAEGACPTDEGEPVRKRLVRRGEVNCRWLYNQVQASRGMILIDTRTHDEYEEDSIPSAISIPPMRGCRSLDDVEGGMMKES